MEGYEPCECGSKKTYRSYAGDICCSPCFKPLKRKVTKKVDTSADIYPDDNGVAVKVNGETVKYFSKYEDYAYTDARAYAAKLNTAKI